MRINSIKIENLFDIFDYDISFKNDENVLIITGPNGFGKTMILNIIFSLFNRQFIFFQKLVFDKITLLLDENISIIITKRSEKDKGFVMFSFYQNGELIDNIDYLDKSSVNTNEVSRSIQRYLDGPSYSAIIGTGLKLFDDYVDTIPNELNSSKFKIESKEINEILDSIQVHLIREQRLFKESKSVDTYNKADKGQTLMIETIQTYAHELKQLISVFSEKSFAQTQELDSSYPNRLRSEKNILTEKEYEIRYNALKNKQKKLTEFGLYESKQEFLTYSLDDAKALSVYLKDIEKKLSVFDDLLEKLEIFTSILNERRFTFKSIKINRTKGFFFMTSKGKELDLSQLSSGEQHEVVLLYELIFNVKPNVLVLIDEPEISLHITWQKEFLNDLLRIIKVQKIQVLIATHAPSIINDRWDLVYNLETVKTQ